MATPSAPSRYLEDSSGRAVSGTHQLTQHRERVDHRHRADRHRMDLRRSQQRDNQSVMHTAHVRCIQTAPPSALSGGEDD